jgi:hypothetical protein
MKIKLLSVITTALLANMASGAVTLSFSNATNWLSNFANGSGSSIDTPEIAGSENRLVWGIIVDSDNNGFAGANAENPYDDGFSLAANTTGILLNNTNGGSSGDVLYIASAVMASSTTALAGEGVANVNRLLTFSGLTFNATLGAGAGDKYAIIWFDRTTLGGTATVGTKYGIFELPDAIDNLPPDGTNASTYPAQFAGVDGLKTMGFAAGLAVPETSTSLLGALGALALLRRRRN